MFKHPDHQVGLLDRHVKVLRRAGLYIVHRKVERIGLDFWVPSCLAAHCYYCRGLRAGVENDASILLLICHNIVHVLVDEVAVLIVSEGFPHPQSHEVHGNPGFYPSVTPFLCADEAAEKLGCQRQCHSFSGLIGLINYC